MKEEAARTVHGGIVKPGQTQSNRIKPNQTWPRQKWTCRRRKRPVGCSWSNPVNPVKPGQTIKDYGLAGVRTNFGRPALRAARPSRNNQTQSKVRAKYDHLKRDAYVSAKAETALGRAHQTESNQIKPNQTCGTPKKFKVSSSRPQIQCSKHQNRRRRQNKDDYSFSESTLVRWRLCV